MNFPPFSVGARRQALATATDVRRQRLRHCIDSGSDCGEVAPLPRRHAGSWCSRSLQIALAAIAGFVAAIPSRAQTPTFSNVTVHDPSIVRDGSTFYVFGSHLASASTTDLMNWTQLSTGPVATNPLVPNPTAEFAEAIAWVGGNAGFWAPDMIRLRDGRYYYYYCIGRLDAPRAALGLAVSDSPTGPYRHVTIMLRSGPDGQPPEAGARYDPTIHPNTIDPSVFFDQAKRYWMVYGSYSGGIFILRMNPETGLPLPGQGYGKKLIGGNHARIEGAYIIYSPEMKYYYLFVSFGGLNANDGYNIRVGRSRNPDGPYVDGAGTDLTNVRGAPGTLFDDRSIEPHGVKLMGSYQFARVDSEPGTGTTGYRSPGHNSAYYDGATGKYFLVFHTRFVGRSENHEVRVHQMFLNEDGWLVAAPHRYAGETIGATLANQVPGRYKLINHGKAISGEVNNSVLVTLNADGSLTGAQTGTWQLSGDRYFTVTLGSTTYRGVISRHWDDNSGVWVRAFSALSNDGVAVWGSKVASSAQEVDGPGITSHPVSRTIAPGASVTFDTTTTGSGVSYQWLKDGTAIAGATGSSFTLSGLQPGDNGRYSVTVRNSAGAITSTPATLLVEPPRPGRLINLSVRSRAGTGGETLIAGFVISGSGSKPMMVRGTGPTLTGFGVGGTLTDPVLNLFRGDKLVAENDSWQSAPNVTAIQALDGHRIGGLTLHQKDSVLLAPLATGDYTAQVKGANGSDVGVALVELYDTDTAAPGTTEFNAQARLVNLSARTTVGTGDNVLIAGFVINGNVPKRLLIRATGPTLTIFGVGGTLADPLLQVVDSGQNVIAQNNSWAAFPNYSAVVNARGETLGGHSLEPKDTALVATLTPGAYTAIVRGVGDTTGVALVEVYDLD